MEFKNIDYKIDNKYILKDISTTIDTNGITLIIGPNGAGKSTFLKIFYRLIKATDGKISLNGKSIDHYDNTLFLKEVSLLRDYSYLFHQIEVDYFLRLNRYRVTGSLTSDHFLEKIVKIFELDKLLNRILTTLSSGEKQRVMLASIFLLDSKYILLDEPFSALDISMKIKIMKLIKKEFSNKIIVMITHDYYFLNEANKIIALKNGKLFLDKRDITKKEFQKLFDIKELNLNSFF